MSRLPAGAVEPLLRALGLAARRAGDEWVARCPNADAHARGDRNPSWRMLDRPGDPKHGSHNCFSGDTKVITRDGVVPIALLAGREAEVLTGDDRGYSWWVRAPFMSFGVQEIWRIVVSRNGVKKEIRATGNHRWFVRAGDGHRSERTTEELIAGHRLRAVRLPRSGTLKPSPWGVAHGVSFGDGTRTSTNDVRVSLWGEKDASLLRFFPFARGRRVVSSGGVVGREISGLPHAFKKLPSLEESPSYLYGWLAGYFAADGCVDHTGAPTLASASREALEFVERVCLRLGVFTYGIRAQQRRGFGAEDSALYTLPFRRSSLTASFFLIDSHRERWFENKKVVERPGWVVRSAERTGLSEPVYCAVVPETHCFALEDFILTGNCFGCGFGGGPAELVRQTRGYAALGSALAWLDEWIVAHPPVTPPAQLPVGFILRADPGRPVFRLPPEATLGDPLEAWPGPARAYARARGIDAPQAALWGLGYAVHGRLAGRLVLPARDRTGAVRNYTARSFTGDPLRYLSADRREGPDWGCLFGEQHWPAAGAPRERVVVTEGALNALCVARAVPGVAVAALSGSQLHPVHAVKLGTFRCVVLLTDPDVAGDSVAAALQRTLETRVAVVRVRLPPGQDALDVGDAGVRSVLEREVFHGQDSDPFVSNDSAR